MEKEYPVLVVNRGGNQGYGMLQPEKLYHFARYGFIAVGTNLRGSANSTGVDEYGGADVNDVIRIIDFAEQMRFANGKIYMFGWSRGAMETYIVLRQEERIDAAVVGAGPTDLLVNFKEALVDRQDMAFCIGMLVGNPDYNKDEYIARSAVYWADEIDEPLYIAHGTEDDRIEYHHSKDLYCLMQELDKEVKFKSCVGQDHSVPMLAYIDDYVYWLKQY